MSHHAVELLVRRRAVDVPTRFVELSDTRLDGTGEVEFATKNLLGGGAFGQRSIEPSTGEVSGRSGDAGTIGRLRQDEHVAVLDDHQQRVGLLNAPVFELSPLVVTETLGHEGDPLGTNLHDLGKRLPLVAIGR